MSEENHPTTKVFNMAISTLMRLDRNLNYNSDVSVRGDLSAWYDGLFELRRSIAPFIKETEFDEINNLFKLIDSQRWLQNKGGKLKALPGQIARVYPLLDELSILMQRAMNNAGILMPKGDDPRFALEG